MHKTIVYNSNCTDDNKYSSSRIFLRKHVIDISAISGSRQLVNIAFGDVFLCSGSSLIPSLLMGPHLPGQSNMEMSINNAFNCSAEVADSASYPDLRLFTVQAVHISQDQYCSAHIYSACCAFVPSDMHFIALGDLSAYNIQKPSSLYIGMSFLCVHPSAWNLLLSCA